MFRVHRTRWTQISPGEKVAKAVVGGHKKGQVDADRSQRCVSPSLQIVYRRENSTGKYAVVFLCTICNRLVALLFDSNANIEREYCICKLCIFAMCSIDQGMRLLSTIMSIRGTT